MKNNDSASKRKNIQRNRGVILRAVDGESCGKTDSPSQELVGIALGFRMVFASEAEVWTVRGILRDGSSSREDIGELSFITIPGDVEPATAVTGFLAPPAPYILAVSEEVILQQIRGMVVQLGYDIEGFYISIGIGGKARYYEELGSN